MNIDYVKTQFENALNTTEKSLGEILRQLVNVELSLTESQATLSSMLKQATILSNIRASLRYGLSFMRPDQST